MALPQKVEDLLAMDADVQLTFSDGTLMANSTMLRMTSPVLRNALEAHTAGAAGLHLLSSSSNNNKGNRSSTSLSTSSTTTTSNSTATIPIEGVTKEDWLKAAAFVYPVVRPAKVTGLSQAELLIRVGSKFDMPLVLHRVDEHLAEAAKDDMICLPNNIWKFLHLADEAGLKLCIPELTDRAVRVDASSCASAEHKQRLSHTALEHLVDSLVKLGVFAQAQPAGRRDCGRCGWPVA